MDDEVLYLSAKEIAEALNGAPSGRGWVCRCPNSLHRDSKPSFSIEDGDSGRPVFHCFGGCTQDELIDALRGEGLWPDRSERREGSKPKGADKDKTPPNVKWAREAWNKSRVIDPAKPHPYFLARGIDTTRFAFLHYTLRIDPEAKHKASDTIGPAVIALVTDLASNGVGIQRTFLADGEASKRKVDPVKMSLGSVKGSAIRIGSPRTARVLVSEGPEDAMTARAAMDFKFVAWASAGLSMLDAITFPDDVTEVVILADNDEPGRKAARKAAQRFLAAGKMVLIAYPPDGAKDFNELVSGKTGEDLVAGYAAARAAIEAAAAPVLDDGEDSAKATTGLDYESFFAYMPTGDYVFIASREHWPAKSVNARLKPKTELRRVLKDGVWKVEEVLVPASAWLDKHSYVTSMSWLPGEPEFVADLVIAGGGRITTGGAKLFNLYRPPVIEPVEGDVKLYADHWKRLYPGECEEMLDWLSFKVQHPEVKINHAIGMGGAEGIGKDTLLAPIREAVGPWNFAEVSPGRVLKGDFNEYMQSVILRVNEAHDVGDFNRFDFHERTKTMIAAPPEVVEINGKFRRQYCIPNLTGVIILTNHKTLGLYLPRTDRRHLIGWSECLKSEMAEFCAGLWNWYEKENGFAKVAHFLRSRDLSKFNPKAEPRKTATPWHLIVDAGMSQGNL